MSRLVTVPHNLSGVTAQEHLEKLRKRINAGKATGPKYAHAAVLGCLEPEWRTWDNGMPYFVVHFGAMRDGRIKHWRVTCRELGATSQRKGKTHRIEADWINRP